jgi:cbb3-type cytochrome oxidase subunit 3
VTDSFAAYGWVIVLGIFTALVLWAFRPSARRRYREAKKLPLDAAPSAHREAQNGTGCGRGSTPNEYVERRLKDFDENRAPGGPPD